MSRQDTSSATKILWGQILIVSIVALLFVWAATQWVAFRLGFQPQLGAPLTALFGLPIYRPWQVFTWWYWYDAYAPRVFMEGAAIAGAGGIAAIAVAILLSVLRAREASDVTTYGSARWAGPKDITDAGLFADDGVVLGRLDKRYLRHDGPEHVLCFAPTRSGKGVGLVVPSLLTWPGSAIVHDIKGENWDLTAGFRARHGRVLLFDPTSMTSAAYNPLLEVRRGEWEVRDVQNIADMCLSIPKAQLEKRNHWEKTSHSLLVGAILHVLYAEKDKTLAGVAAFLSDPRRPIEQTLEAMMRTPISETARIPLSLGRARATEQVRERTLRRSVDGHVLPWPLPRSGRRPVTRRCDWRIDDLVIRRGRLTLYLVVPPSDISRTKPLIRLILNQIGRRLTEDLKDTQPSSSPADDARRISGTRAARLLRSALAFMAGYGIKSLPDRPVAEPDRKGLWPEQRDPRQLPCPRAFATNDERTAKRCPMRSARQPNARDEELCRAPAGTLAGHLMVSRQETARAAADAGRDHAAAARRRNRHVSGSPPIRAKKARYFHSMRTWSRSSRFRARSSQTSTTNRTMRLNAHAPCKRVSERSQDRRRLTPTTASNFEVNS
jgi:type IV secretion system protein VirD4